MTLRICLIDDNALVRESLTLGLADHGCDVIAVDTGAEALALLARETVDAIVTDMAMPGMDGAALIANVRAQFPDLAIVAISGSGAESDSEARARALGADVFLSKPFKIRQLIPAIESARNKRKT